MFWKLDVYLDVFVLLCTVVERYFRANMLAYELLQVQEFPGSRSSTRAVLIHTGTRVDLLDG